MNRLAWISSNFEQAKGASITPPDPAGEVRAGEVRELVRGPTTGEVKGERPYEILGETVVSIQPFCGSTGCGLNILNI